MKIGKPELQKRANCNFQKIPKEKWSYFHKKTIENFIFHLPNLEESNQATFVNKILSDYLDEIDQEYDEINMDLSEHLYNEYLVKILKPYERTLNFFPVFGKGAFLILGPVTILTFYIFRNNSFILIFLASVFVIYFGLVVLKSFKRKLYGFGF